MKNIVLLIPLLFVTPSCETVRAVFAVPGAVVEDVSSGVSATTDALTPDEQAAVDTASGVAQTGGTLLGGPAVGAGAGALAAVLAGWLIKRRRKPAA